jgi:carbon-monoxide dehydrogenase medium subunit
MKAPAFTYHDPRSLSDLKGLLGSLENVRMLAGGQSLMPMLNMRFVIPDHVVDLNKIPELTGIRETAAGIEIGAMTRQRAIERDPIVKAKAPVFVEALSHVGHIQTRSRGTFGGSLCHLDPASEQPGIAALYDADLSVTGPRGDRTIAMNDWGLGYMTPALEPDEALIKITLKTWKESHGHGFAEFARRHGDYAIVACAALLALDGSGKVSRAAISIVGVDVKPVRLEAAERALVGHAPDANAIAAAAEIARGLECLSDAHVAADYRQRLAGVMTKRALEAAARRAKGEANV